METSMIQIAEAEPKVEVRSRKRRLLLVEPYPPESKYRFTEMERRILWFPKLSLPVIAAYTPENWDITFVDEAVDRLDFTLDVDLVGISAQMTCYAPRAYQIAQKFRERGITTVIGGTHVTYEQEEAARYADVIMVGESEGMWPQVIKDFEAGRLEKFYRMGEFPDMSQYRFPRVDLWRQDGYMTTHCIQTTRGCHFECEFCSVSPFNGKQSRRRPVSHVVAEIQRIKERRHSWLINRMTSGAFGQRFLTSLRVFSGMESRTIFAFVDDLHNSNREYCKELWTALIPLNIRWGAQCTLFLGDEPELVSLAAKSGCVAMFVGMESIIPGSIEEMNKPFNQIQKYEEQIKCFHDHGIMVNPGVIFGSDHEDVSVFKRTVDFLKQNKMELAYFNIATPLPGTALFERMKRDNRVLTYQWDLYDGKHVVFQPKKMSVDELQEGFFWANQKFFSWPSIMQRVWGTRQRFVSRLAMNYAFRHLVRRTAPKGSVPKAGILVARMVKRWQKRFSDWKLDLALEGKVLTISLEFLYADRQRFLLWLTKNAIRYIQRYGGDVRFRHLPSEEAKRPNGTFVAQLQDVVTRINPNLRFTHDVNTSTITLSS